MVLSLDELTSHHSNANKLLKTAIGALSKSSVPVKNVVALVMYNPSVMHSLRKKFVNKHPWVLVSQ